MSNATTSTPAERVIEAFRALPPLQYEAGFWNGVQRELRARFNASDITEKLAYFLRWPEIASTMFVGEASRFIAEEAASVVQWRHYNALHEDAVGSPPRMGFTSGALIHCAYHIVQWENAVGKRIEDVSSVVEVGGGFGALAKVMRRAGYSGAYTIYDLPEFSLLQRYYLAECGIEDVALYSAPPPYPIACDLLIGVWSLSEMRSTVQRSYLSRITASHHLLALNNALWEGEDSRTALEALPVRRVPSPANGSFYLMG